MALNIRASARFAAANTALCAVLLSGIFEMTPSRSELAPAADTPAADCLCIQRSTAPVYSSQSALEMVSPADDFERCVSTSRTGKKAVWLGGLSRAALISLLTASPRVTVLCSTAERARFTGSYSPNGAVSFSNIARHVINEDIPARVASSLSPSASCVAV